jgi:hypothetical protein
MWYLAMKRSYFLKILAYKFIILIENITCHYGYLSAESLGRSTVTAVLTNTVCKSLK